MAVACKLKIHRLFFCLQSTNNGEHPNGARVRVALGALTGVIAGFCLAGPYGAVVGAAIGAGIETWS